MIGYRITRAQLEVLIEQHAAGWLRRAKERTRKFRKSRKFKESSSIWSEVKPAYMQFQGQSKCVYCERKLESVDYGKIEQDVEHFRPKSSVKNWKLPKTLGNLDISITAAKKGTKGYYLLPYDVFNYAASCKPCNSALKSNYFPIAGRYKSTGSKPESLATEKPYLIYPIGDFDDLPEKILRFHGVSPQPIATQGHIRNRVLVTIEFFKLDDFERRKNLIRERACIIVGLYPQLENIRTRTGKIAEAERLVSIYTAATAPHANCARSFVALHANAQSEASDIFDKALGFIESIS